VVIIEQTILNEVKMIMSMKVPNKPNPVTLNHEKSTGIQHFVVVD
jgi:hypothetical protein